MCLSNYALLESPSGVESADDRKVSRAVCQAIKKCVRAVDERPTAFDTDKVIEQMEQREANFDCKSCKHNDGENAICSEDCSDALIDDLIKIVKGGGVDGN